jgi:hypothetical protein
MRFLPCPIRAIFGAAPRSGSMVDALLRADR